MGGPPCEWEIEMYGSRSPSEIQRDANLLGKQVAKGERAHDSALQVLCAHVEELAECVDRLSREVESLKARS